MFKAPLDKAVYRSPNAKHPQKMRTILSFKEGSLLRRFQALTFEDDLTQHFVSICDEEAPTFTFNKSIDKRIKIHEYAKQTAIETEGIGALMNVTAEYSEWLKIGVSLHCIYGAEQGFKEFQVYSQRWQGFDENDTETLWDAIVSNNYMNGGWGVIRKYLPKEHWDTFVPKSPLLDCSEQDILKDALNSFTAFKIKKCDKKWYRYEGHRWQKTGVDIIRRRLWEHISQMYKSAEEACTDGDMKKIFASEYKKVGSVAFSKTIISGIEALVSDDDFESKLNQNPFLLAFNNGIYELDNKVFRDGRWEDYVSFSCGYNFREEYDEAKVRKVEKMLMQICCENEERYNWVLRMLGRSLIGNNSAGNQKWYCWYGKTAGNGKSTIGTMLQQALGQYYHRGHTTMLTQASTRADSANPEIVRLRGTRIVMLSETESKATINTATLKTHTGESTIPYRGLYQDMEDTKVTWTIFLMTNEKQKLDAGDNGVRRRTAYVPFKAKFVDTEAEIVKDPPEGHRYYLKDADTVDDIIKNCKMEFMHLLLRHCDPADKMHLTGEIARETNETIQSADPLNDMLIETFEPTEEKDEGIAWSEMRTILKRRHGVRYDEELKKAGTATQMIEYIEARLPYAKLQGVAQGKPIRYRLRNNDTGDFQWVRGRRVFKGIREISDYVETEDTEWIGG
jgi:phage/plasmid-associated DNA primase